MRRQRNRRPIVPRAIPRIDRAEAIRRVVRREAAESTRWPGKFKGEARYVPYFYDCSMESGQSESWGSSDEGGWFARFDLDTEDVLRFPELAGRQFVTIMEGSLGFVEEVEDAGPDEDEDDWDEDEDPEVEG